MKVSLLVLALVGGIILGCAPEVTVKERIEHGKTIGEQLERSLATSGFRIRELQIFPVDPVSPCPEGMKADIERQLEIALKPYLSKTAKWTLYVTSISYDNTNAPELRLTVEAKLEDFEGKCAWKEKVEAKVKIEANQNEVDMQKVLVGQCCEELKKHLPLTKEPAQKVKE